MGGLYICKLVTIMALFTKETHNKNKVEVFFLDLVSVVLLSIHFS